jgi:hypothetical protein
MLRNKAQPSISADPKDLENPHYAQCHQTADFFPTKGGVSETTSPKTIMSGETLNYKKHLSLQVGQYCQVHEENNPRNSQLTRTKGAIYLGPNENLQGGFKFMALKIRKKIVRQSWDVIPTLDLVIFRANSLGSDQPHHLTFTDRHGRLIGDIEIPGVDSGKGEDDHFPGVEQVIKDDIDEWMWKEQRLATHKLMR